MKKMTVYIPDELHFALKLAPVYSKKSMTELINSCLKKEYLCDECGKTHELNEQTKKVLEESAKDKGITRYSNAEEMFGEWDK